MHHPDPDNGPVTGHRIDPEISVLKRDLFGQVSLIGPSDAHPYIQRDTDAAPWWTRPVARALARREARTLRAVEGIDGVPQLISFNGRQLTRSFLGGQPMHRSKPASVAYFHAAQRLVFALHRQGVVHNDTAKEPNWLVLDDGRPGLIDFQLAMWRPGRGRLFRMLAREDVRHLLKHKRTYAGHALTTRQRHILHSPAWTSRAWRATVKPVYLFVTRKLLRWSDREGAADRNSGV